MSSLQPAELLAQLRAFNSRDSVDPSTIDPVLRSEISNAARHLSYKYEAPSLAISRVSVGQAAEASALSIAFNIGLFPAIAQDGKSKTLSVLAQMTDSDPVLLLRVLRLLAAFGVVLEEGDKYALNQPYALLGNEAAAKALKITSQLTGPMTMAVADVVRENGRRNPDDRLNGAVQKAFNAPGQEPFEVFRNQGPGVVEAFSVALSSMSKDGAKMHQVYPVQERLVEGFNSAMDEVMWVDVGGGIGQLTLDLKQTFPNIPGKLVVQDQGPVVEVAKAKRVDPTIEFIAHDFFTQQPIKGARAYYLRHIFHNWQDSTCKTILEQLKEALKPGYSRILIHETVMPETGATPSQVIMDWLMMAGYSTLERTEKQWQAIVEAVGLKINKIYSKPSSTESIIEVIKE